MLSVLIVFFNWYQIKSYILDVFSSYQLEYKLPVLQAQIHWNKISTKVTHISMYDCHNYQHIFTFTERTLYCIHHYRVDWEASTYALPPSKFEAGVYSVVTIMQCDAAQCDVVYCGVM